MMQVLFYLPFTSGIFPPSGVPVYGFGLMLFLTFVITAMWWGPRRAQKIGLPEGKLQDLAIILFITGIAGARVVYMIQYRQQYSGDWTKILREFLQIWNGGIVVYGAVFGGLLGYAGFYYVVLRKYGISGWKLADVVAPLIAIGMAVGRIGCYLNGCCWGQPACVEACPVPLSASLGQFPILPAHSRDQVCQPPTEKDRLPQIRGLQTMTGFTVLPKPPAGLGDPRPVIAALEADSAARAAGIQPGERIVGFQGQPNRILVEVFGPPALVSKARERLLQEGAEELSLPPEETQEGLARLGFSTPEAYRVGFARTADLREAGLTVYISDQFSDAVRAWPRGQNQLTLDVAAPGESPRSVMFIPRTIPFFPTQLYETVSMLLLVIVLVTFQPLRRHNGQVMILLMLGYAAHRFLNEALRIEPTYALDLTLSQWISLGIIAAALALEGFLRLTMPRLPAGPQPLGA
jgi:prolipoprotein diacylglyceryltransferase